MSKIYVELKFNGTKFSYKGENFLQIPSKLFEKISNANLKLIEYKLIMLLIGTKPGFILHENWVTEQTGLDKSQYSKARKGLKEKGWISYIPRKEIVVNFGVILSDGNKGKDNEQSELDNVDKQITMDEVDEQTTSENEENSNVVSCSSVNVDVEQPDSRQIDELKVGQQTTMKNDETASKHMDEMAAQDDTYKLTDKIIDKDNKMDWFSEIDDMFDTEKASEEIIEKDSEKMRTLDYDLLYGGISWDYD